MSSPLVFTGSGESVTSHEEAYELVTRVQKGLEERGFRCPPNSTLGFIFIRVKRLYDEYLAKKPETPSNRVYAGDAVRIAGALELVLDNPDARELIKRITRSDMRLSFRHAADGKDALWELDLYAHLHRKNVQVFFREPPDLVVKLPGILGYYGVACKKAYSHNSVEKQMRKGCAQLAASTYPGIVAFNLDDLTPQERILQAPTKLAAAAFIQGINQDFVDRHRETFQRAVLSGRCDGVLVSTQINVYADEHPGHNRMYVTSLWKFDKDEAKASRMEAMQALL